ncbi:uncharacterized protein EURHEDRAFT_467852 [Aspergillus ruber CBS 135680]|uniref:Uncharacterized protein n=1 Tax=Aspergillus ruber (strain CBS 135680) TaxID=1388766 RepID=A0A017S006_ASPRC|nr:uncharacterized protein EURHEDRAFT_467852 [Aspergillus ruber CBS 135680]EYE90151.1 hypothetical protein EURHEDRAFT_467852 [Aspergillus ruber CBS 135680]
MLLRLFNGVRPLRLLMEMNSMVTPGLLGCKVESHGSRGLVPSGLVCYLV